MCKAIIEVNNVSVDYIVGDLRNIGLKEYVMKRLTRTYNVEHLNCIREICWV